MKYLIFYSFLAISITIVSCNEDFLLEDHKETLPEAKLLRECGTEDHQSKLLQDPDYRRKFETRVERLSAKSTLRSQDCSEPIVLPVAVHFQSIQNPNKSCLVDLTSRQIDILNADFLALNEDIDAWQQVQSFFPGVEPSSSCIKFCLATKNHPSSSALQEGEPAVTFNETTGDLSPRWAGYINIFVQFDSGYLGYAPLGGVGDGDGVVIDAAAFGAGNGCGSVSPESPFDLGRTLTHEMGHYLLLDHLWGDGGCNSSDDVNDTPQQSDPNYGCPSAGIRSCNSSDLFMSYMDYADDACMYMFSGGQASRMYNYVNVNLQSVIAKGRQVCSEGTSSSDTDNDGVSDSNDNCPSTYNPDQKDSNANGIGDVCEDKGTTDSDNDGIEDGKDNCPNTFNPDQTDTNDNGIGDVCEEADPNACNGIELTVQIRPDDYPEEIEWQVINANSGEVVFEGYDYQYDPNLQLIEETMCLPTGCYEIVITDSYGDGICCDYGDGNFRLLADQSVFYESDGDYGVEEYVYLCIQGQKIMKAEGKQVTKVKSLEKKKSKF